MGHRGRPTREEEFKRRVQEGRDYVCAPIWAQLQSGTLAKTFGGGESGEQVAAFLLEIQRGLPPGSLSRKARASQAGSNQVNPDQTESNQIKPNQIDANRKP